MERPILLLGDPRLYQVSTPVPHNADIRGIVQDLHDTLMAYRGKYGAGRAIAAPQIGVPTRILYMHIDRPVVFLNPVLTFPDDAVFEVLDDCMSFPGLYVRVLRHKRCEIAYEDAHRQPQIMRLEGDLSELLQHEYDHLDGILATMRAIDNRSLFMKPLSLQGVC